MGAPRTAFSGLPRVVGRYALYGELASGGMATVLLGRLMGPVGFARTVAIKKLHAQYAKDPHFVEMFVDEARLAARIRHPNVVPTLDVVAENGKLLLVMEYVHGESLWRLLRSSATRGEPVPPAIACAIMAGVLHGLHAAHEATSEHGELLGIVHRDISPQNILVCADGLARVLDFGIAKATGRLHTTQDGSLKGKLAYMSPEQFRSQPLTRKTDIYAAAIVLWETLTAQRLFVAESQAGLVEKVLHEEVRPPSSVVPGLPPGLDDIVLRGLARDPADRYETAQEMALALEECMHPATAARVGAWVTEHAREALADRAAMVAEVESGSALSQRNIKQAIAELGPLRETIRGVDSPLSSAAEAESAGQSVDDLLAHGAHNTGVPVSVRTEVRAPGAWLRWGLAVLLSAVAGTVVALVVIETHRPKPVAAATAPGPSAIESSSQATTPMATTQGEAPLPPPTGAPVENGDTTPASLPKRAAGGKTTGHAAPPTSAAPAAAAPATSAPPPDCSVPFTLDANGDKKWKLECLGH